MTASKPSIADPRPSAGAAARRLACGGGVVAVVSFLAVLPSATAAASAAHAAAPERVPVAVAADPRPFGIVLGSTTCGQALRQLGGAWAEAPGGGVAVTVDRPQRWYAGATSIALRCDRPAGPVLRLSMAVNATDAQAHGPADTFHALERRYPLVEAAGADPRREGRAVFGRGATRAELVVRPGAGAYDLVYTSAAWRNREAGLALQRELRRAREADAL